MRRSFLMCLCLGLSAVFFAVFFAGAGGASSAARRHLHPMIICPLSQRAATICCGPPVGQAVHEPAPQPICCPGAPQPAGLCPLQLTISAAPDPSTADGVVKVAGRVGGRAIFNHITVVLWQKLPQQGSFHRMMQTTTNPVGLYTFVLAAGTVKTNRSWYVTALALRSQILGQRVEAVVGLSASAGSVRQRALVTFKGHVAPSHAGERIRLERRTARVWVLIATVRLDRRSDFAFGERFTRPGREQVRAVLPGDDRNIRSHSSTYNVAICKPGRPCRAV